VKITRQVWGDFWWWLILVVQPPISLAFIVLFGLHLLGYLPPIEKPYCIGPPIAAKVHGP
jgi:hypothetical protein